jgi:hypothetical protein
MEYHVEERYEHFQPIYVTIIFKSLQEADDFVRVNERDFPDLCEEIEKITN